MDNVFDSNDQDFITGVAVFRTFYEKSVAAKMKMDKELGLNNRKQMLPQQLIDIGINDEVFDAIDPDDLRSPLVYYNFQSEETCQSNVLPSSQLRSLERFVHECYVLAGFLESWMRCMRQNYYEFIEYQFVGDIRILKQEHEKRLNPQYRSVSQRNMRYDRVQMSLITMERKEDFDLLDQQQGNLQKRLEREFAEDDAVPKYEMDEDDDDDCAPLLGGGGVDPELDPYDPFGVTILEPNRGDPGFVEDPVREPKKEVEDDYDDSPGVSIIEPIIDSNDPFGVPLLEPPRNPDPPPRSPVVQEPKYEADDDYHPAGGTNLDSRISLLESDPGVESSLLKQENDLIVCCSVFIGYNRPLEYHEIRLGRLLKVTDCLLLGGESTLLDLKNSFCCPSDFAFHTDMSAARPTINDLSKFQYPSSFFFINDTFYVDLTPENAIDISLEIREWAARRAEIAELKVAHMQDCRMIDLTCRLGQPYLYVHQGRCEHLIVFSDIRLRNEADAKLSQFPVKLCEKNFRRIPCAACKMATAEWAVMENDRMTTSPCFQCDQCYREFNFSPYKWKIGNFIAVPYCDRKAMDNSELFISRLNQSTKYLYSWT